MQTLQIMCVCVGVCVCIVKYTEYRTDTRKFCTRLVEYNTERVHVFSFLSFFIEWRVSFDWQMRLADVFHFEWIQCFFSCYYYFAVLSFWKRGKQHYETRSLIKLHLNFICTQDIMFGKKVNKIALELIASWSDRNWKYECCWWKIVL